MKGKNTLNDETFRMSFECCTIILYMVIGNPWLWSSETEAEAIIMFYDMMQLRPKYKLFV